MGKKDKGLIDNRVDDNDDIQKKDVFSSTYKNDKKIFTKRRMISICIMTLILTLSSIKIISDNTTVVKFLSINEVELGNILRFNLNPDGEFYSDYIVKNYSPFSVRLFIDVVKDEHVIFETNYVNQVLESNSYFYIWLRIVNTNGSTHGLAVVTLSGGKS